MRNGQGLLPNQRPSGKKQRSSAERERDKIIIAHLYLRGYKYREIIDELAERYGYRMSMRQITKDISDIHKRWVNEFLVDYDALKARELARIDELERSYWDAWDRSMQKIAETETERVDHTQSGKSGAQVTQTNTTTKAKRHEKERDGEEKFLRGIERCIEMRAKILGLDAPEKVEISWRQEAARAGIDPDALHESLVAEFIDAATKKKAGE